MLSFWKNKTRYSSVQDDEYDSELKLGGASQFHSRNIVIKTDPLSLLLIVILFLSSIFSSWILFFNIKHSPQQDVGSVGPARPPLFCTQVPTRREWRTLTVAEQHDYVRAVRCLATKPSTLGINGTLYDDFPWVHKHTSSHSTFGCSAWRSYILDEKSLADKSPAPAAHASAPFLPWHRYYLHLYETALKQECSFHGNLPYWDWSLDYSTFLTAPVWSPSTGLGGDGTGPPSVGNGNCVTTGPFSDLNPSFYDTEYHPHCLSRSFPTENELQTLGQLIRPEAIAALMNEENYRNFAAGLETRAHTFLSHSVRGDLSRFTGPNDPIFFLHHVNIDRIWWQWQQARSRNGLSAYEGRANNDTEVAARVTDVLDMGGLARSVMVVDVMDTKGGRFCYEY